MKSTTIALILILSTIAFQCKNITNEIYPSNESNLSPEELEFVRNSSERLIAIWSITKTKSLKKGMSGSLLVKHSIENFINQVTDPNEIALYKEFVNHPEARKLFNWAASSIDGNLSQGKISNEFSPEDILSQEVKYMLNQLKENMGYTADAYEYAAVPYLESMLRGVLDDFITMFSTTLI